MLLFLVILDTGVHFFNDRFYVDNVQDSVDFANKPVFDLILSIVPGRIRLRNLVCDISILVLALSPFSPLSSSTRSRNRHLPRTNCIKVSASFKVLHTFSYAHHPFTLVPSLNPECFIQKDSPNIPLFYFNSYNWYWGRPFHASIIHSR